ncbi:LysM peptidoglycan-binding domain-containing protein [Lacrimispora defluvii]|uniref:LysM peptidoglycan-binding domain-containing protein n=1 Tax=Lacrimispora defluvii TaxID=2719233 RepID=A0ABX1W378_9FIRM|nr:LysM peptidoglycan-binding domain-containing protein [Lacrimispora defluvii]NNJ32963.1 LysM peptidoglycan-binding domain-containing protein [Lacrimispora defluvii]
MIIHVVRPGETINTISDYYKIPVDRLILENGIINPDNLVIGQTIVIVPPKALYIVQSGDTLDSIAMKYSVSPMELIRNNPYLSDREFLYSGETIVISYQTDRLRTIAINGYAFSYIEKSILIKTLPFLTYLTIFDYRATSEGEIISIADDTEVIQLAKAYGVMPVMFVSTITEEGTIVREITKGILDNPSVQDRLIDNILQTLKAKGYNGINMYIEDITTDNLNSIIEYIKKASAIFHSEGYKVIVTTTPIINIQGPILIFEKPDYSKLSGYIDEILFASYDWARFYSYPSSIFPINVIKELLEYITSIVSPELLSLGITTLGYDWTLPYVPGATDAIAIANNNAIQMAADGNIPILFNEAAYSPFFYYIGSDEIYHLVWFKDARSFEARINLVAEYNLQGLSLWTIMRFDTQMWFIINTQFNIEKVPVTNSSH